jgi:DegV family protein with EDD domain
MTDFTILLTKSLNIAQESLARTKEQMEVLRKANVVDAGAQGFVYILEGVVNFIQQGTISRNLWMNSTDEANKTLIGHTDLESNDMHFCTECLLIGQDLNHKLIQESLSDLGNSTVVVGSQKKVRVHIHSNNPGKIFDVLRTFGEIQQEKIDDIFQQEKDVYGKDVNHDIVIVTDSCCDLPKEIEDKYNIHKIPLKVNFGKTMYIDELTITDEEFYKKMTESSEVPKTSQLSLPDCKRVFEWTSKYFINTVAIHMSRVLSGSVEMAHRTASQISSSIKVIDSRSICVGLGIIVDDACRAVESGLNAEKVAKRVEWASNNYQELFTVRDLTYLIRGGRLSASKGFIAKLLHLKPLLHVDTRDGSLHPLSNAFGLKGLKKKMIKTIQNHLDPSKQYRFGIGPGRRQVV